MIPVSLAMVEFAIAVIVCLICGYMLGYSFGNNKRKPIGTLRVDSSDPDGPYLFLELETDPDFKYNYLNGIHLLYKNSFETKKTKTNEHSLSKSIVIINNPSLKASSFLNQKKKILKSSSTLNKVNANTSLSFFGVQNQNEDIVDGFITTLKTNHINGDVIIDNDQPIIGAYYLSKLNHKFP